MHMYVSRLVNGKNRGNLGYRHGQTRWRRRRARRTRRHGTTLLLQLLHQRLPARFGEKEAGVHLLQAYPRAKDVGPRANQHHVRRLLHHRPRQADGMPCARHPGHRPGLQIRAVHDGRVQLVFALGRENRAPASVEERIVFENLNRSLDRIQRRAAPLQHLGSGSLGLGQRGAISRVARGAQRAPRNHSSASVHHDAPVVSCLFYLSNLSILSSWLWRLCHTGQRSQCKNSCENATIPFHRQFLSHHSLPIT